MSFMYPYSNTKKIICNTIAENLSTIFKRKIFCTIDKNCEEHNKYIAIEIAIPISTEDRNLKQIVNISETIYKTLKNLNILNVQCFHYNKAYIQCDLPNNLKEIESILTVIKLQNS